MKVVIFDSRAVRGASLKRVILDLGCECDHFANVWGENPAPRLWNDSSRQLCAQLLMDNPIVFAHNSDDFAEEFARDLCRDLYVVFYSGGGLTSGSIGYLINDTQHYPKHCIFTGVVHDDASLADWNLAACLRAMSQTRSDVCEQLHGIDPRLEAKLNFLHACLSGLEGINAFLANSREQYGWNLLKDLDTTIPWQTENGEQNLTLLEIVASQKAREFSRDQLVCLRDGLLGRD